MSDDQARKRARKVAPGDGTRLKPYRWWEPVWRSLLTIAVPDDDGSERSYAVDVDFFDLTWDLDTRVRLYRDGVQVAVSTTPAAFPIGGRRIEVATSTYGLTRAHLVTPHEGERALTPHPRSGEGRRAALAATHPVLSQVIGGTAIAVLLVSLAAAIPAILELVTGWDVIAEHVGTYDSPLNLPSWATTSLVVAAIAAAIERALTLRNHWLLDAETGWLDG